MKIEMHCHTSDASACAMVEPERAVDLHAEVGYNAMFITNHLGSYTRAHMQETSDRGVVDRLVTLYRRAKVRGDEKGIMVWLGLEVTITVNGYATDVLLYGIDERFLTDNTKIYSYNSRQLSDAVRELGGMVYQAHPYRTFPPPNLMPLKDIDGIESYNGHPEHFCNYLLAREYALTNNLRQISGSDFHEESGQNRGGIIVPDNITSPAQLINYLKFNKPQLLFATDRKNAFPAGNQKGIFQ